MTAIICLSCNQPKNSSNAPTNTTKENQNLSASMSDEEKIIQSKRELSNEAIRYKDTNGVATLWGDDFEMLTSRNVTIKGVENNRHFYAMEFANKPEVKYERKPSEIKAFPQWRMASEYGVWTGSWKEADGKVNLTGTYYAKWHFTGNQWKLRSETYTAISCEGSRFCDQVPILEYSIPF